MRFWRGSYEIMQAKHLAKCLVHNQHVFSAFFFLTILSSIIDHQGLKLSEEQKRDH